MDIVTQALPYTPALPTVGIVPIRPLQTYTTNPTYPLFRANIPVVYRSQVEVLDHTASPLLISYIAKYDGYLIHFTYDFSCVDGYAWRATIDNQSSNKVFRELAYVIEYALEACDDMSIEALNADEQYHDGDYDHGYHGVNESMFL